MRPLDYQISNAKKIYEIFKDLNYVYIQGKPRSGKTPTSLVVASMTKAKSVLVLCPKGAKDGWYKFLEDDEFMSHINKKVYVHHYEQIGKVKDKKITLSLNPKNYDLVIVDESHNFGKLGKPSNRILLLKALCRNLPHIHLSGTAIIESPCSIYHQMAISKYSPFNHTNFYNFHREYGIPYYIKVAGRTINQYDKYKPELLDEIKKFSYYITQEDAGIKLTANDKLHYVKLSPNTVNLYKRLEKTRALKEYGLIADTVMKLRTSLHMLESGVIRVDDKYIEIPGSNEKIEYILNTFGDTEDVGIMCHFVGERQKLSKYFKKAKIYSSTAHAEGVDLSHLKHFVILSSGYSGAKFVQRRERIINIKGSRSTIVNHILVKSSISEKIYNTVSKKRDFNNKTYLSE